METCYDIIINLINKARVLEAQGAIKTSAAQEVAGSTPSASDLSRSSRWLSAGLRDVADAEFAIGEAQQLLEVMRREVAAKLPRYILRMEGLEYGQSSNPRDLIKSAVASMSRPDDRLPRIELVDRHRGRLVDHTPYLPLSWREAV